MASRLGAPVHGSQAKAGACMLAGSAAEAQGWGEKDVGNGQVGEGWVGRMQRRQGRPLERDRHRQQWGMPHAGTSRGPASGRPRGRAVWRGIPPQPGLPAQPSGPRRMWGESGLAGRSPAATAS